MSCDGCCCCCGATVQSGVAPAAGRTRPLRPPAPTLPAASSARAATAAMLRAPPSPAAPPPPPAEVTSSGPAPGREAGPAPQVAAGGRAGPPRLPSPRPPAPGGLPEEAPERGPGGSPGTAGPRVSEPPSPGGKAASPHPPSPPPAFYQRCWARSRGAALGIHPDLMAPLLFRSLLPGILSPQTPHQQQIFTFPARLHFRSTIYTCLHLLQNKLKTQAVRKIHRRSTAVLRPSCPYEALGSDSCRTWEFKYLSHIYYIWINKN